MVIINCVKYDTKHDFAKCDSIFLNIQTLWGASKLKNNANNPYIL